MSDYFFKAKNKQTGEVIEVSAMDNHFGHHRYGYKTGNRILTEEELLSAYEELDFTAPPTITRDALNNYIEQTAERNDKILERYLNGAPTPNTGTEWEEIREIIKLIDYEGGNTVAADKATDKIIKYYATQKSHAYQEGYEEGQKHAFGVDKERVRAEVKSQLIAEVEDLMKTEKSSHTPNCLSGTDKYKHDFCQFTDEDYGWNACADAVITRIKGM